MSPAASRCVALVLGVVVLIAGFFFLNYTNGFGIAHHSEWAAQHGMPAPSYGIFIGGAVLEVIGAGTVGHSLGRRARPAASDASRG